MNGRASKRAPRMPGRHTQPRAGTTATIPDSPEEAPVTTLSDAALEAIWSTALAHNDTAGQAKRAAAESTQTFKNASTNAAALLEEGNRLIAQGREKLAEAEQAAQAAKTAEASAAEAGAAQKHNEQIVAELWKEVDRHVAESGRRHPAEHRPMAIHQQDIDPNDPFATQRHGPVTDTTAEFPPVPPSPNGQGAAAFRKGAA